MKKKSETKKEKEIEKKKFIMKIMKN